MDVDEPVEAVAAGTMEPRNGHQRRPVWGMKLTETMTMISRIRRKAHLRAKAIRRELTLPKHRLSAN